MKKLLVTSLTTALVAGAASTTFAAANPFADVPADHWAYDAVAQLAQDGLVNGYADDGTFKGDQHMSRYEMAQLVAKAMAKSDAADNNNKALIDKLAAEFSDELSGLGVRIANLEEKVDNVKWTGLIRYDWNNANFAVQKGHRENNENQLKLRFTPSVTINNNWTGHAEIDYNYDYSKGGDDTTVNKNDGKADVGKIYAEGKYGKAAIKLGRFGSFSDASHGLFFDDKVTGAEMVYAPDKRWSFKATGGRVDAKNRLFYTTTTSGTKGTSGSYAAVEAGYKNGKFEAGLGYHIAGGNKTIITDHGDYKVWDAGIGYAFDKNLKATADYSYGNSWVDHAFSRGAYSIQMNYKGADAAHKGSWGAYVAYRNLTPIAAFQATYDHKAGTTGLNSLKGWELGVDYTWTKNIVSSFKYFNGKDNDKLYAKNSKVSGVWSRLDFIF
ncbi:S-layer homology domain-containing protein [Anaerovibrio sp.]|uniref:S-layer homology domain-containing protein n=1 Tax=Anaerovibrio sp. TaxID=1872532 RepID=UPI003F15A892